MIFTHGFKVKRLIYGSSNSNVHQCYYCEQIFESKESLFDHVEVHSDVERNREITNRKKKEKKS